jgi:hypothetical protein
MADDPGPMKVWTNRVPPALVDAWKDRASQEGTDSGAMLRHVMAEALGRPRIMPAAGDELGPEPAQADRATCPHPRKSRRPLGYTTLCGECGSAIGR